MISIEVLDKVLALGAKAPEVLNSKGAEPLVAIPFSQKVESLAQFYPPTRIKRKVTLLEANSFIEYVNRFKTDNTLIFANVSETGVEFSALLDYHGPAPELEADYCDHIAKFTAIETPEWKVWKAADRSLVNQVDFATWLEDNLSLFTVGGDGKYPAGADLLELVKSLHGHRNARFSNTVRLDNGAYSAQFDEDIVVRGASSTRDGEIELPPMVCGGLAVFQGADAYEMPARLKSRCVDRKLMLTFETVNRPKIVRESILLLTKQVGEKTSIIPMLGIP